MLMLRKRANSNDVSVLIKTAPLKLCSDCYTLVRGKFTIISSLVCQFPRPKVTPLLELHSSWECIQAANLPPSSSSSEFISLQRFSQSEELRLARYRLLSVQLVGQPVNAMTGVSIFEPAGS
jgi:hypothetical protein